jgi:iron complex transport system permease protein
MSGSMIRRVAMVSLLLAAVLLLSAVLGLSLGSTERSFRDILAVLTGQNGADSILAGIIWRIRLPRVILASLAGAALSLGGLVFQTLLRNPIAEPYVLGISGGAAVGAIIGILFGLAHFPGVALLAFAGSMATLLLVFVVAAKRSAIKGDFLILAGVMINAFCSSIIIFLVSMTGDSRIHSILFWLMGDLSSTDMSQAQILAIMTVPCFAALFFFARPLNLLLMGEELAGSMGVNVRVVPLALIAITSFMVSATVCHSGLLGFVGLVVPHMLRLLFGADHRLLIPSCILAGASYLVLCDLLAGALPARGEMPVGVVTAMIGAPLFIFLLVRSRR